MRIQLSDHFSYRRLIRFTLPSIAMMIFTSIYGVVDGFFVSNFAGKTPFAAVNLIWPALMIFSTVGFMLGTGGTAVVSRTLGEGDQKRANEYFSLFVYLAFGLGVVFSALGIGFAPQISTLLGAEDELLKNCVLYARIVLLALPFFILQMLFQSFFVTAEKPHQGLIVTLTSGVTNMVLDCVLIMLLPQAYKLVGAAAATALSQFVGGVFALVYFFRKNNSLLRLGKTHFYGKATLQAFTNGSSEFMSNVSMSLVGMLYNLQLMNYAYNGEDGIAAYGVMMYVSMIFSGAFIGYSVGTAPVVGYHYGAQNEAELKSLLQKSLRIIMIFSVAMAAAAELLAVPLAKIFVGYDARLMEFTVHGFRIFSLSFLLMGIAIYGSGFFTALSDGLTSALISGLRTLVFQIAAVLLLPMICGVDGVWISIVVAEFMAAVLTVLFLFLKRKKYRY